MPAGRLVRLFGPTELGARNSDTVTRRAPWPLLAPAQDDKAFMADEQSSTRRTARYRMSSERTTGLIFCSPIIDRAPASNTDPCPQPAFCCCLERARCLCFLLSIYSPGRPTLSGLATKSLNQARPSRLK